MMKKLLTIGLVLLSVSVQAPATKAEELSVWDYSQALIEGETNIRVGNHKFTDLELFQLSKGCLAEAGIDDLTTLELDALTKEAYTFQLYDKCIQVNTKNKPPKWTHTCPYRACSFTGNPYKTFFPK